MQRILIAASVAAACGAAPAQQPTAPPAPLREMRGAWVATVDNIDWPSEPGLPTAEQQRELDAILDRAASLGLNAIVLQVRPTADALYRSKLEPWSEWLTGAEGRAPKPEWDPLEHAVEGCHRRGLELHAWFNPYRVRHPEARSQAIRMSLERRFPDMVVRYGKYLWMDPGHPRSAQWSLDVILDVVRRYDIDGVHLDDYFYPYPIAGQEFPDERSYQHYRKRGGKLARDDWRRHNVDEFIRELYEQVKAEKRWVQVGISPFGIARPGLPEGIKAGIDQYEVLYADVQKWLAEGWCDYMAPQLYWPTKQTAQSFAKLLPWWATEVDNPHRRHVWPGLFASAQAEMKGNWTEGELLAQVAQIRAQAGASGHIHFSMCVFSENRAGLFDAFRTGPYAEPALVPASPWLDGAPPAPPRARCTLDGDDARVTWSTGDAARFVFVQELRGGTWRARGAVGAGTGELALPAAGLEAVALTAVGATGAASEAAVVEVGR